MSADIDVEVSRLRSMATNLENGSAALEGLDASAPSSVDAGPMTSVVLGYLAQIVNSAGNLSTSMAAAGEGVRLSADYYERSDADADASLTEIRRAMES